jgi:glycosyltransferase involved in cell wall biosynthesis
MPSSPWRVLHLGKFFPPDIGGMETYLADLVDAQRAQGVDARVLAHGHAQQTDPKWLVRVPVQTQLMYAPVALGYRKALARLLKIQPPEVLHLHLPNPAIFWVLTLPQARALPWVVHWHSDVLFKQPHRLLRIAYCFYRHAEQAVLALAKQVVVTSPPYLQASTSLRNWRAKCKVVPLGLRVPTQISSAHSNAPHHWTDGKMRVLSLGRLAHYKGFNTLIQAVATMPDIELVIAGHGELWASLKTLVQQQAPNVRLLGHVSEEQKQALLTSCDVFALASNERTEAFGMVLLEAMMHAKPCVVSDLPGSGMPWVLTTSQAGLSVETNNVAAWREALRTMANQPQQRQVWGEAARTNFHSRFTADASAKALWPVYESALGLTHKTRAPGELLIVVPARNESRTIGALMQRLRGAGYHHIVVIDDLSTDGTGDIARREGAQVLRPVLGLGAWGGMQTGIRYALQQGFDTVITMDADGQHEVEELPTLLAANGPDGQPVDVVIGAHPERASRLRHLAWAWFRWLTGLDVTDLTSGFRCYRARALPLLASDEATLLDYQDLGTLLLLRHAGLKVIEVPVHMNLRVDGISRIFNSWFSVTRYMAVTTLLCLSRWGFSERMGQD